MTVVTVQRVWAVCLAGGLAHNLINLDCSFITSTVVGFPQPTDISAYRWLLPIIFLVGKRDGCWKSFKSIRYWQSKRTTGPHRHHKVMIYKAEECPFDPRITRSSFTRTVKTLSCSSLKVYGQFPAGQRSPTQKDSFKTVFAAAKISPARLHPHSTVIHIPLTLFQSARKGLAARGWF